MSTLIPKRMREKAKNLCKEYEEGKKESFKHNGPYRYNV